MIQFEAEDIDIPIFNTNVTADWIANVINIFGKRVGELRYIFCTDEFLYDLNVKYLNHNTYTDIITFDTSENPDYIAGEMFISLERVAENAVVNSKSIENELFRVLIHGVLHLIGFNDKLDSEIIEMRSQEEKCLSLLP
ncbi:MAG: rRNA maturation RNase YbeY [Bacteroidales bacterium]|nr:rRNA maturation RNase YbeY [Bacteroidales bacterium]